MKLKINNSDFLYFNDITLSLTLDAVASGFSFSADFNPDNLDHKELFRPLAFNVVQLYSDDDELLLTGPIVNHSHKSTGEPNLVTLSGYSRGGVLQDVNIPVSAYPLESINRSFKDIATRLLGLFELELIIDPSVVDDANAIYKKSMAEPGDDIAGYLSKLASQRNMVRGHDPEGNIVVFRPDFNAPPKMKITHENSIEMGWSVNGQAMFSDISVIRQPTKDNPNSTLVDTVKNPLVKSFRPKTSVLTSGTTTDTRKAANNKLAAQLDSLKLALTFESKLDLAPGEIIEVENPEMFLYNPTKFVASTVTFKETEDGDTTAISLVLPEAYTGGTPKDIFA